MNVAAVPRHIVATPTHAVAVLRELARDGWVVGEGFALSDRTGTVAAPRIARYGRVDDRDTARLATQAAARGVAVVVIVDLQGRLGQNLLADLTRLGPVRTAGAAPGIPTGRRSARARAVRGRIVLLPEQRALLDRLAAGETIAAAASAEFLSLRTANRRIAAAREILGARTTREAVRIYLRLRADPPQV